MLPDVQQCDDGAAVGRVSIAAWYTLTVLVLLYTLSFIDRTIITMLVAPIKRDLAISDLQMSLLMGLSFALFYTFCGLPLGRAADRHSRRLIIFGGITVWSLAAAACGLCVRFEQLFLARMFVGLGEAALSPAAFSLLADLFPRRRLGIALSIYSMGAIIGSGLALGLGGTVIHLATEADAFVLPIVGELQPWQFVFFITGAPGLLLALLALTISEPPRTQVRKHSSAADVLGFFRSQRQVLWAIFAGFGVITMSVYGLAAWIPTFMARQFGMLPRDIGPALGAVVALGGIAGHIVSGLVVDRLTARGVLDACLRFYVWSLAIALPFGVGAFFMETSTLFLLMALPIYVLVVPCLGMATAALQLITPVAMRGQISAAFLFFINLVGLGGGPSLVAFMAGRLGGEGELGRALMLSFAALTVLGWILLWRGLRPMRAAVTGFNPAAA